SIAFSFFLSLFPAIIFLFTLLPMFPLTADYISLFKNSTQDFLPLEAHNYLFGVIEGVLATNRGGLRSVGFIFAIVFSSSGMLTLMYGFNKSYELVFKKRSYMKNRLVAIILTLLVGSIFMISIFLIILGQPLLELIIDKLNVSGYSTGVFNVFKWLIVLSVVYLGITIIYRYGSAMKEKLKWINTGAILATLISILSSLVFSFFINSFGRYNEIYGSIGALIVLLVWIQINAFIVLIGFELNAGIAVNKVDKILEKED
ncbi:MAG: YihY/virulence factor BrkB family protein, partial [Saprospiraceae bacterium]|nr:YihY/virulence factor BrkB family protein [Bacteroidia bacterium]NNL92092.1 YihY/virulence factor BrkB family protein [Saprospiraceae bacterium]